jgi:hypothetical protein
MAFMVPRIEEAFFELPTTHRFLHDRESLVGTPYKLRIQLPRFGPGSIQPLNV